MWCVAKHKKTETITTNIGHQLPVITKTNIKYFYNTKRQKKNKKKVTQPRGAGFRTRELLLDCLMVLPLRHTGMNLTAPFTLPFCTPPRAYTLSRCSCQRCKKDRQCPRPQLDGGDAHRAMLPDHARYPPQGRAARVR